MEQRIAKAISIAGVCSRRQAELLILQALVKVNGVTISSPAYNVNDDDIIIIKDKIINRVTEKTRLWTYYKPAGLVTTHIDTHNRPTVFSQLPGLPRVISIGRLDINSEGLLLLTNSGELARKFELPSSKLERVYKVRAYGDPSAIQNLSKSITIEGILYSPKSIRLTDRGKNSWFEVVLTEGKNREIRKIFAHYGLTVSRLIRTRYGHYKLGDLKAGQYLEQQIS